MDLTKIRDRIDEIDTELVKLLCDRMEITKEVAAYKKENNMPVLDRGRELAILDKVGKLAGEDMAQYVRNIYEDIFTQSKSLQRIILNK